MDKTVIAIPSAIPMVTITGPADTFLAEFERAFPEVGLTVRGNEFLVRGPEEAIAEFRSLISELLVVIRSGQVLTTDAVVRSIAMVRGNSGERPGEVLSLNILSNRGKTIRPKTANQKKYVDAIDQKTVTFGIGPAGTGKTYLAVAKAVQALQAKSVNRIILTRPAVEAGERLGFLPGTLHEKIDPYLRPLFDSLQDMVDGDSLLICEAELSMMLSSSSMRRRTPLQNR
jgi:phosphate starvation-inducible PhoH-like protein